MKTIIITILSILLAFIVRSQSVNPELVCTAGDEFKVGKHQISWTIGETVTGTYSSAQIILSGGFFQGDFHITSVNETQEELGFKVLLYPNPATKSITLDMFGGNFVKDKSLIIYISDINGKIVRIKKIKGNRNKIVVSDFSNGLYFLTLKNAGKVIKYYKILKK